MMYQRPPIPDFVPIFLPPSLKNTWRARPSLDRRTDQLRRFLDSQDGRLGLNVTTIIRRLKLAISGIHAGRLFKNDMGMGVREYAKRTRLITAAVLLRLSPDSVKQIAAP